ncbi:MAG: MBL fold metallo-hydrolase [Chloroflexota bacterium]
MLFERVESEGLAHYSYLFGDGTEAAVIDPRRDVAVYVERATQAGMRIKHVLETHRNEDYVVGSRELAEATGATVWHSAEGELEYGYGRGISDGDTLEVGRLELKAMHTPGHTMGHMSYLLRDPDGAPWILFSGDALFAGDVGRTDFYGPERLDEMTGLLYDTLFNKLLPLGDEVIVCPAHGAGSACGAGIAERTWTTLGLERKHNPRLQHTDREAFVANVGQMLEYPPYFEMMEVLNLEGPPVVGSLPHVPPLRPYEFASQATGAQVVDTRLELGFGAAHVPGALSIWERNLPRFAGWFLTYDRPVLLVTETNDVGRSLRYLWRLGFDNIAGFLAGGMLAWHTAGLDSEGVDTITVQDLCHRLDEDREPWILDVRSEEEVEKSPIPTAHNVHLTQLPDRMDEVLRGQPVFLFCGSGIRSMTAASLLQREGYDDLTVVLGGLAGWSSLSCPLE